MQQSKTLNAEPIWSALVKLSLPVMVGQLFNLIYNLVDTGFIAALDRSDPYLLGSTGMVFPIIILMWAVAFGLGGGITSLVSRSIGAKNTVSLDKTAESGLVLAIGASILFLLLFYPFALPILKIFGANGPTLKYALEYMVWVLPMVPFLFLNAVFTGILQGEGRTIHMMIGMVIGAVVNIVLDYILMFPMGMGIAGAGLATVLGNASTTVYLFIVMIFSQRQVRIHWRLGAISISVMAEIMRVGLPQGLMNIVMSLSFLFYNRFITDLSPALMSAFTLYSRVEQLAMIPVYSLAQGLSTVAGQAAGARYLPRLRKSFVVASAIGTGISALLLALYVVFHQGIFRAFLDNAEVLVLAGQITPWLAVTSVLASTVIMANTNLAAAGFSFWGLILTIIRVFALNVPAAAIGTYLIGKSAVAVVIGIMLSSVIALLVNIFFMQGFFSRLDQGRLLIRIQPGAESMDA
jgi:putative MATE family efflux protein